MPSLLFVSNSIYNDLCLECIFVHDSISSTRPSFYGMGVDGYVYVFCASMNVFFGSYISNPERRDTKLDKKHRMHTSIICIVNMMIS